MLSRTRLANEAWEALFRAQATLGRELLARESFSELAPSEYGVLHALSRAPEGLRISDLGEDVLLTQPGMSRLVARLEARGFLQRAEDSRDGRARLIQLTEAGAEAQRRIGLAHGHQVAQAMTHTLDREDLIALRELCAALVAGQDRVRA